MDSKIANQVLFGICIASFIMGIIVAIRGIPWGGIQMLGSAIIGFLAYRGMKKAEIVQPSKEQLDDQDKALRELGLSDELAASIREYRAAQRTSFGTFLEFKKIPEELRGKVIEEMKQKAEEQQAKDDKRS
jgi:hypothetical protein